MLAGMWRVLLLCFRQRGIALLEVKAAPVDLCQVREKLGLVPVGVRDQTVDAREKLLVG